MNCKEVKKIFCLISVCIFTHTPEIYSVQSSEREKINRDSLFVAGFSYTGDVASNLVGGIKQGVTYMGLSSIGIDFDSERAWRWNGSSFRLSSLMTHGGLFSEEFVGDRFTVDNQEAGNHLFLNELYYKQSIKERFDFTIGLQDLNVNFASCEESSHFLHSAFGINTVITSNVSTPIFPLTGLGVELGWNINNHLRWQSAIYDGYVDDFENNPWNVCWKLNKNNGYLLMSEWSYANEGKGSYKFGLDYHTKENRFGIYAIGEKRFGNGLSSFAQACYAPKKKNEVYAMFSGGINYHNIFARRYEDLLSVACVTNLLSDIEKHETIVEITYKYQICKLLFIQPDIQYIINPSGEENLKNALALLFRTIVEI